MVSEWIINVALLVQGIIVSVVLVVIIAGNINGHVRGSAEDFENLYWGYDFGLEKKKNQGVAIVVGCRLKKARISI